MTEVERIHEQLKRAFEGHAWHGPSVLEAIRGIDARTAAARPIPNAHSIWEIVLHITTWERVVARRLKGDPAQDIRKAENWPPVTKTTAAAWRSALKALKDGHKKLRAAVLKMKDEELDQTPAKGTSTRYVLAHGVIQHDLYHSGQIMVLSKAD